MKFNMLYELYIQNNDIYMLECHQGWIIVNNNYSGINVYNFRFELQDTINIFEDIIIHSVFKNATKNEILLYCPDNQAFVHINLTTKHQKTLKFTGDIEELGLSSIYYWSDHTIVFLCVNKKIYTMNTMHFSVEEIDELQAGTDYPIFNKMRIESKKYSLLASGDHGFIYENKQRNELGYWDYFDNTQMISTIPDSLGHQVICLHDMFLSVHEKYLQAIKNGQEVARINIDPPFAFLKARKQSEYSNEFIVLSGSMSNVEDCCLTNYVISH